MEKSKKRTLQLGIFVFVSALILIVTVYLIGQKEDMFSSTFNIRVQFGNVNGLQAGNNVRLSGINVGSVLSVTILNDSTIEVVMRIRENVRMHIKKDAVATIGTDGLMGNMLVNISPGDGRAPIVEDGDVLETYSRIKTDDMLETLTTTNENAAMLTADLLEIVQDIKNGKGTVSYLLTDSSLKGQVTITMNNLRIASERTNQLLTELQQISKSVAEGQGLAGWIISDTTTQTKIAAALQNLEDASTQVKSTADSLNMLMTEFASGEGIIPALMTDTAMVNDLRATLSNLNMGTAKFNEDMEALQHHFLFKKYFKDQEKESKK
ncbi:MAG: MlaD family protein [Cyclobacteriaceae bacterium]